MGWVLVRAFGIIVGIATLLRLATTEKLVTYEPLFQQWLEVLTEFVDHAFLIKFIGPGLLLAIDYVRSFASASLTCRTNGNLHSCSAR